jgi:fumarate hydratase subunit alpha
MRTLSVSVITQTVKTLFMEANVDIGSTMLSALQRHVESEASPLGKSVLAQIIENDQVAKEKHMPICQDTGMSVVFVKLGQDVHLVDGDLNDAIHEGVRQAYRDGYLRKSVVSDPLFARLNTKDNTPAVIHLELVKGDQVELEVMPKGFGSENMSALKLFAPSVGVDGVKRFILDTIQKAGPNACPPMIVGVGIGGTFELAALLAKKAVLRSTDHPTFDPKYAELEKELLSEANALGLGPAGLGGSTTALAINIETYPTHIASIPVAVNISCHASRHAKAIV